MFVCGNWKMNITIKEVMPLVKSIGKAAKKANCEVGLAVPYTDIAVANQATLGLFGSKLQIGAQNCHWEPKGAFTGEISAQMIKEIGGKFCIVGHSERRQYFGDTNETVAKRAKAVMDYGMRAIVCVGETLEERNGGKTKDVLKNQIENSLKGLEQSENLLVIAYEPIWAIGTGKTATSQEAEEACEYIRSLLKNKKIMILYGGSVKPTNALELFSQKDIDGALVGGASLVADEFISIINQIPQSKLL